MRRVCFRIAGGEKCLARLVAVRLIVVKMLDLAEAWASQHDGQRCAIVGPDDVEDISP
jgi:hypothetical protein